ncbi:MAG: RNA pseudouridine synthase [Bacteroidetes bacterium]|nr:RNA pseudouridine synthase [Bacteroidota bacterium]
MNSIGKDILFEDNHILIYNKQPSQIVQGDKTGDIPLSDLLKAFIKERDHKPGNVFLGVVHRIDRPVSGAVIFAKTSKALTRLNEMIKTGSIRKTYWAVVKNLPSEENGHLIHYLKKNEEKNKSFASDKEVAGSRKAELTYCLIGRSQNYFLLEVNLLTGRHHQIRCQLSKIGCPIKGDLKYGFDRSNPDGSIHLHARKIVFSHPVSKEVIEVVARPPDDKLWSSFLIQVNNKTEEPL